MNERDKLRARLVASILGGMGSGLRIGSEDNHERLTTAFRLADSIIGRIDVERRAEEIAAAEKWLRGPGFPPAFATGFPMSGSESGP